MATQGLVSHHVTACGKASMRSATCGPSELDLMALIAGLRLRERWEDFDRSPFTSESRKHVSVWEKPAGGPSF